MNESCLTIFRSYNIRLCFIDFTLYNDGYSTWCGPFTDFTVSISIFNVSLAPLLSKNGFQRYSAAFHSSWRRSTVVNWFIPSCSKWRINGKTSVWTGGTIPFCGFVGSHHGDALRMTFVIRAKGDLQQVLGTAPQSLAAILLYLNSWTLGFLRGGDDTIVQQRFRRLTNDGYRGFDSSTTFWSSTVFNLYDSLNPFLSTVFESRMV